MAQPHSGPQPHERPALARLGGAPTKPRPAPQKPLGRRRARRPPVPAPRTPSPPRPEGTVHPRGSIDADGDAALDAAVGRLVPTAGGSARRLAAQPPHRLRRRSERAVRRACRRPAARRRRSLDGGGGVGGDACASWGWPLVARRGLEGCRLVRFQRGSAAGRSYDRLRPQRPQLRRLQGLCAIVFASTPPSPRSRPSQTAWLVDRNVTKKKSDHSAAKQD